MNESVQQPVTNINVNTQDRMFPRPAPVVESNKPKKPHIKQAMEHEIELAEQRRNLWHITTKEGVTPEDVEKPEYWANCIRKMKLGDRIEVVSADGSWDGELSVRAILKAGMNVEWRKEVKRYTPLYKLAKASQSEESQYSIDAVDGKYRIVRKSDGEVIISNGFPDEPTARHALREYLGIKVA